MGFLLNTIIEIMKRSTLLLFVLITHATFAQLPKFTTVHELSDPYPVNANVWNKVDRGLKASFVSIDESFLKSAAPSSTQLRTVWKGKAWRGEKVHTQVLLWSRFNVDNVKLTPSDLVDPKGNIIASNAVSASFIRYVLTDHAGDLKSGCGIPKGLDTSLTADLIDNITVLPIEARTSRPVWLSLNIPRNTVAGIYKGTLTVSATNERSISLPYEIEVLNYTLPEPRKWSFHLDIWQNPYSVSRVHGVKVWSSEHFEAMKPYIKMLADAGQKSITADIIYDPWNGQTYDIYQGMIKWVKKKDGTWSYDYTNFDKWVDFMMGFGIDKFINCYSMIPWNLKFYYYDEAAGKNAVLAAKPGEEAYNDHWKNMLIDFAKHLKEKGWFEKTTIAMDEREMEDMKKAIAVIKEADPAFKISLAGNDHPELYDELVDYCVALRYELSKDLISERREKGFTTTFYTCCTEPFPNTFTSSTYAEATWLPWYALNKDFDGYLRWAYNCWGPNPLQDTRVGTWLAGDGWFVYPGARTSIRFERLIEGIQDFEKAKILKKHLLDQNKNEDLKKLNEVIRLFEFETVTKDNASTFVNKAKEVLNSL